MKKRKIINIVLIMVVVILVLGIIRSLFVKGGGDENKEVVKQEGKSFDTTKLPEIQEGLSPKSVSYTTQTLNINENIVVYKADVQEIDDALIKRVMNLFSFKGEPVVNEEGLLIYNNEENNTTLDVNKDTMTIKFSKNLLLNSKFNPIITVSEEEIVKKLNELVIKIFDLDSGVTIKTERVEYERLAGPRFVNSTKEKGNIVKIMANYEIGGYPVFSINGFPIIARFAIDGNLLNLTIDSPIKNIVKQKPLTVKTDEELSNAPAENYRIMDIDGGKDYDMSSVDEIVDEVKITQSYMGYRYDINSDYLLPYIFFKGNSRLASGPVVVILALPALKEEFYYGNEN